MGYVTRAKPAPDVDGDPFLADLARELRTLSEEEAAAVSGLPARTLQRMRDKGVGPAVVRPNGKTPRYRPADLRAWMDAGCPRERVEP